MMRPFLLLIWISLSAGGKLRDVGSSITEFDNWVQMVVAGHKGGPLFGYKNVHKENVGAFSNFQPVKMDLQYSLHPDQYYMNVHIEPSGGTFPISCYFLPFPRRVEDGITTPLKAMMDNSNFGPEYEKLLKLDQIFDMEDRDHMPLGAYGKIQWSPIKNEGVVGLIGGNEYLFSGTSIPTKGFGSILMNHVMALFGKWMDPTREGKLYLLDASHKHIGGAWWDDSKQYNFRLLRTFEGYANNKPLSWYSKWGFVIDEDSFPTEREAAALLIRALTMGKLRAAHGGSAFVDNLRTLTGIEFEDSTKLGEVMTKVNRKDAALYVEAVKSLKEWVRPKPGVPKVQGLFAKPFSSFSLHDAIKLVSDGADMERDYPKAKNLARAFDADMYDYYGYGESDWNAYEDELIDMYLNGLLDEESLMDMLLYDE